MINKRRFSISKLVPQEMPRAETLGFYADLYKREGSLARVDATQPPRVELHDGKHYVADGNQRCMFYLLNDMPVISAFELDLGDGPVLLELWERLRERGINSFSDLVGMIREPDRYRVMRR